MKSKSWLKDKLLIATHRTKLKRLKQ